MIEPDPGTNSIYSICLFTGSNIPKSAQSVLNLESIQCEHVKITCVLLYLRQGHMFLLVHFHFGGSDISCMVGDDRIKDVGMFTSEIGYGLVVKFVQQ